MAQKLDIYDFVLSVILEHEKKLDEALSKLEASIEKLSRAVARLEKK